MREDLEQCEDILLSVSPTVWVEFRDEEVDFESVAFDTCQHGFDTKLAVFQVKKFRAE